MKKRVRHIFIFSIISTLPLLSYSGQQEGSKSSGITTLAKEFVEQLVKEGLEDYPYAGRSFQQADRHPNRKAATVRYCFRHLRI